MLPNRLLQGIVVIDMSHGLLVVEIIKYLRLSTFFSKLQSPANRNKRIDQTSLLKLYSVYSGDLKNVHD